MLAFNQEMNQKMIDMCLSQLRPGHRRFGTQMDSEIKACFARFQACVH